LHSRLCLEGWPARANQVTNGLTPVSPCASVETVDIGGNYGVGVAGKPGWRHCFASQQRSGKRFIHHHGEGRFPATGFFRIPGAALFSAAFVFMASRTLPR
jgi:hypothetical protein